MAVSFFPLVFRKPAAPVVGLIPVLANIPFQPVALWLFSAGRLVEDVFEMTDRNLCQGVACATGQGVFASNGLEGGGGGLTGCSGYINDAEAMAFTDNDPIFGPFVISRAAFVSFNNLGGGLWGFTLNWLANPPGAGPIYGDALIHAVAIGGSDITNVAVHKWAVSSVLGAHAEIGVGFKSDFLLSIGGANSANGVYNSNAPMLSVANCELQQWCVGNTDQTFTTPATIVSLRQQQATRFAVYLFGSGNRCVARLTSMDADGWSYETESFAAGGLAAFFSLCFAGVSSRIGAIDKRLGIGLQPFSVAPLGVPAGLLLASDQHVTDLTEQVPARLGIGVSDGTRRGAVAAISPVNSLNGYGGIDSDTQAFVKIDNLIGTVEAAVTGVGLVNNLITLDWTISDLVATQIFYAAVGTGGAGTCAGPVPPPPASGVIHHFAHAHAPQMFPGREPLTRAGGGSGRVRR